MSVPGNKGMESLIQIINGLLDASTQAGLSLPLDLPQIAVVGSQSAGKSSVLENIVGRDFLPRGSGIVTRRPLVLQLTNAESEYAYFLHCKQKRFEDFDEIRSEIEKDTDRETGTNKGISEKPINLQIFSPNVLDITLVDLPGLTKVPIGDQPPDIEQQTRKMILNYISKENCLILAVTPANIDLANSDALKLAQHVDPDGNRTIGVITKLDLMDPGTDARNVLENQVFPLQRGYIGVVNRSQKDIDGKKDIQTALKSEADFFVNHPAYNHMADRCGTFYLQQALNRELTEHIRKSMPTFQDELQKKITFFEREVGKYEALHLTDPGKMGQMITTIVQKFASDFKNDIGAFGQESFDTDQLSSGAQINLIFHRRLPVEIGKIEFSEKETLAEIDISIRNIHGIRVGLFSPQMAFEKFAENQISKLKTPITLCINLVLDVLVSAVQKCTKKIIYSNMREYLKKTIIKYIKDNASSCKETVLSLIEFEMSYMNTIELDFKKTDADAKKVPSEEDLHQEVLDIFRKLQIYLAHVKKNMKDMVPKAITYSIIKKLVNYITFDVMHQSTVIKHDDHPKLLKMDGMDEVKYKAASKMLEACKAAMEAIHNLSDQTNAIGASQI